MTLTLINLKTRLLNPFSFFAEVILKKNKNEKLIVNSCSFFLLAWSIRADYYGNHQL